MQTPDCLGCNAVCMTQEMYDCDNMLHTQSFFQIALVGTMDLRCSDFRHQVCSVEHGLKLLT